MDPPAGSPVSAIVLAGGLGTRLGPLSAEVPKPMLPVGGRPFVEYLVHQLKRASFENIIFACGHRSDVLKGYFGDGRQWGISIQYSDEAEPLGTAGAIKRAAQMAPGQRFLVMNGDSYFDIDPRPIVDALAPDSKMAMALARVGDSGRFGRVELSQDGMIVRFVQSDSRHGEAMINAGIYGIRREILNMIPADRTSSLEHEVLPALAGRGLRGLSYDRFFVDIGVPETYLALRANPDPLLSAVGVRAID